MVVELFAIVIGMLLGMFMGLLPGIGAAGLMLMLYPLLLLPAVDIWVLMCIYIGITNSGQYYGSVSASVFGVLGEPSSLPAVKNGYPLTLKGKAAEVLASASSASYIAVLMSMFFTSLVILTIPDTVLYMMKGQVVLYMLCGTAMVLIATSGGVVLSAVMMALGMIVSLVGYDDFFEMSILTFGIIALEGGMPMFPLFCGLLLVPIAYTSISQVDNNDAQLVYVSILDRLGYLKKSLFDLSIMRGATIGFICGFIPGSGYVISSNLADTVEKNLVKDNELDDQRLCRLKSAEAANNAGSVSVLIPLLMFGLPIVFSEAIFMAVAEIKGFSYSYGYEWFLDNWQRIVVILLIVNTANWLLAGVFFDVVLKIYANCRHWIYHFLIAFSMIVMLYLAYNESRVLMSLTIFICTLPIGLLIKNDSSKFVFVYAYFVSELIVDEVYRMLF